MVHVLDGDEAPVTDNERMSKIAVDYYKNLFRWELRPNINLKADFFNDNEKVLGEGNARFSKEEIKKCSVWFLLRRGPSA